MSLVWTPSLDTGISIIDTQHRCLADHINQLEELRAKGNRTAILGTVVSLIDHTTSHFAFEESLLEEVGYSFIKARRRLHQLFMRQIRQCGRQLIAGGNIGDRAHDSLCNWLVNHIQQDDIDYVPSVRTRIDNMHNKQKRDGWMKRVVTHLF